jgi:TerB-C domain
VVDSVTDALTPYSRWLARTPGGRGSVASTALLPDDLLDHDPGPLRPLLTWTNAQLDGRHTVVVDGRDFGPFWSTADPATMSREESASLAVVLARVGLGVEPDVRFAGPALGPGPVVLFRLDPQAEERPSPGYQGATTMLGLAAALPGGPPVPGREDQHRLDDTVNQMITALAAEVQLTVGERSRLAARLRWQLTTGADTSRLHRRAEALTSTEREAAGQFLVAVAASRPPISAEIVSALTKAYRVLGLHPELLYRRLHHHGLTGGDAAVAPGGEPQSGDDPVVVRRGRTSAAGHPLPRVPPRAVPAPGTTSGAPADGHAPQVRLSQAVVTRTLAETEAVSALLTGIFADDGPRAGRDAVREATAEATLEATPDADTGRPAGTSLPAALDGVHSRLLRELATRSFWSRSDLAELAAGYGVLPSGALDVINEVAMEIAGEPVVEGDDELRVNHDVLREILA